jgi:putative transposase
LNEIDVGPKLVAIASYVLMSNHFHILVKETQEGGISSFMEKLQTGYSMYFNKKNQRVGPLFQGRFKAEHVDRDEYLKYLFAYIHLNPIKFLEPTWKESGIKDIKKVQKFIETYQYSSYQEYIKERPEEALILSKQEFPDYFSNSSDFKGFIEEWLTFSGL